MFASSAISGVVGRDGSFVWAPLAWRLATTAAILGISVAVSDRADWQPLTLVAALSGAMVGADLAAVRARRIRISSGLMVQTTIMALLGPGPAAIIGVTSIAIESPLYRVPPRLAANNALIIALLGLVGGVAFDALRAGLDLDLADGEYALLVLPLYVALSALNLVVVAALQTQWPAEVRVRILRDTGVPAIPFELVNGIFAMAAVFVWAEAGIATAATLVLVLVVTMPLARTLAEALRSGDDLRELRVVSDERAAEVARLASDRERLLSEVMGAEARERSRLAESLHDGPMQRFLAIRQDAAGGRLEIATRRDGGTRSRVTLPSRGPR